MRIVWDEPKRLANIAKHGLDFADIDPAFFRTAAITNGQKKRFRAFGTLHGMPVVVVFSLLGSQALSIISLRRASRRERARQ